MTADPAGVLRALAPEGAAVPAAARALRRRVATAAGRACAGRAARAQVACGGPAPWARAVLAGNDAARCAAALAALLAGGDSVEVAQAPGGAWAVTVRATPEATG
jgi:hypothetical protein